MKDRDYIIGMYIAVTIAVTLVGMGVMISKFLL